MSRRLRGRRRSMAHLAQSARPRSRGEDELPLATVSSSAVDDAVAAALGARGVSPLPAAARISAARVSAAALARRFALAPCAQDRIRRLSRRCGVSTAAQRDAATAAPRGRHRTVVVVPRGQARLRVDAARCRDHRGGEPGQTTGGGVHTTRVAISLPARISRAGDALWRSRAPRAPRSRRGETVAGSSLLGSAPG
jgi:hypothetical protein